MELYTILSNTVESYPDKLALICGNRRYTYTQFKKRVDKLAQGLKSHGIRKDDKIAIIHHNCHRFMEAYFAAAKIGAILVPVNYRLAPHDFIYILNNSQAKVLIAQPHLISSLMEKREKLPLLRNIILTESIANKEMYDEYLGYEQLADAWAVWSMTRMAAHKGFSCCQP